MKTLKKLIQNLKYERLQGDEDKEVSAVVYDSRKVTGGCLFVCIRGSVVDGHRFAENAAEKGASVLVAEEPVSVPENVTVLLVPDTRKALAELSCAWFDHPAEKLKTIGVTGTKGKTTTTYMIASILKEAGHNPGLIGTIETIIGEKHIPSENTTPESYVLQESLAEMVKYGCDCVVMEVSSQALMLHRSDGFVFDYGIFTNIGLDHIGPNEHTDFEQYLSCKKLLLSQCRVGIVNRDDPHYDRIVEGCTCKLETFGVQHAADLKAEDEHLVSRPGYLGIAFRTTGRAELSMELDLPGIFNIYNSLAAMSLCLHFGVPGDTVKEAMKGIKVKGRAEMIPVSDSFTLMIDYAHNAMSLKSLLKSLREYQPHRIVCLFGCGGNRSRDRRFEMGEVSGRLADFTIITSDNPRNERPEDILADIRTGIERTEGKFIEIPDRKDAIRYAIRHGEPGDIIVLAGKGHEDYQIIKGKKYPMDERVLIQEILSE